MLEILQFGQSSADRNAERMLRGEGEEDCADDLTIVVNKATAVLDGRPTDLLKTKGLIPVRSTPADPREKMVSCVSA